MSYPFGGFVGLADGMAFESVVVTAVGDGTSFLASTQ